MKSKTTKIPRLARGKGYLGAEHYGCCNSGARTVLYRAKFADVYIVGRELDVDRALHVYKALRQIAIEGKRVIRWSEPGGGKKNGCKYVVYAFKTRSGAIKKWTELNDRVIEWNASERAREAKYRDAVKRGDVAAALKYVD